MGAGGSVAQELASPRKVGHVAKHRQSVGVATPATCQYREMLDHLRNSGDPTKPEVPVEGGVSPGPAFAPPTNWTVEGSSIVDMDHTKMRFTEEMEVLRAKYGEVDQDALIVKLLVEEISFATVEAGDLPALKQRQRDKGKVYLLGETHFMQDVPAACVNVASIKPKALEMVGDEELYAVAREALPANTRTSKKAVELMGSTKVVTEKKALKRLGSEMTEDMRALQMKSERKQQKEEMNNRRAMTSNSTADASEDAPASGAGGNVAGVVGPSGGQGVGGGDGGGGEGAGGTLTPKKSMGSMRVGSPGSFMASTPMARRATRLLTEVPKFINNIGGGGSKTDVLTK